MVGAERFSLSGDVAVVTGALGRLGPVWCRGLLEAGASVVALDHPDAAVGPIFAELTRSRPDSLRLFRADSLDRVALSRALERTISEAGEPTVLVNNAGIDQPPARLERNFRFEDLPTDLTKQILDVNVVGTMLVTQVFGASMVRRKHGSIVTIGSLYASVAPDARFYEHLAVYPPFLKPPAYGASKAALVNLMRYLATLWGPLGVRVNVISPGGVLGDQDETFRARFSERVPLRRLAETEELVGPLVFLASRASSYVNGHELVVDGGFTAW